MTSVQTISRDEIDRIEKVETPEQAFEAAFAKAKTAADFVALGKKAKGDGLAAAADRAFAKAIELDKDCKEAHEARGDRFEGGRWWTPKEWSERPEEKAKQAEKDAQEARDRANSSQEKYAKELEGVSWGDGFIIPTKHYIVKCNSTKEVAQRYADFLEKIYAAYDKVFSKYKHYWDKPSNVYIFRNIQEFQDYMRVPEGYGGFYVPESDNPNAWPDRIVAAFHGRFGTTGDTRHVLAHEGTHQMEHILCQGSPKAFMFRPTWWVEGLAVYFGDGYQLDSRGNLKIGIPRDRLAILQQCIEAKIVPEKLKLSDCVKMDHRSYVMQAGLMYPYGWSLCYYFLHRGEDKKGQQKPVKIKGKDVNLAKVFDDFFKVATDVPPNGDDESKDAERLDFYAKKLDALLGFPVDDLTDDWKQFIMGLELPKLGKVKGAAFESPDMAFTVEKPKDWKWNEKEVSGREAIRMECPETTGLIVIQAEGNMENQTGEEVRDETEQAVRGELTGVEFEEPKEFDVGGYKAYELVYKGTIEAGDQTLATSKPRTGEQWFRRVMITTLKRSYHIVCQCNADMVERNKDAFDKVIQGFKVLKDKEN